MAESDYDVVIVNYNGAEILGDCLDSLYVSKNKPQKIIIFDNNSSDNSVSFITKKYPQVELLKSKKNIGFGPGNNEGLKRVTSPFVLFVNNDVLLDKNCTSELLAAFREPKVAAVDPLIYKGWERKKKNQEIYAFGAELSDTGFAYGLYDLDKNRFDLNNFSAACVMMRSSIIKKIKFEPSFFLYSEEPMISIELMRLGYKIGRIKEAFCYHLESYSSPGKLSKAIAFRQFYSIQNRYYMIARFYPFALLIKAWAFNLIHFLYFLFFFIRTGSFKYLALLYIAPYQVLRGLISRNSKNIRDQRWFERLAKIQIATYFGLKKKVFKS